MPAIAAMPKINTAGVNQLNNLPPLKGQRQGPISDPIFLNKGNKNHQQNKATLNQQPEQTDLLNNELEDFGQDSQQEQ